MMGFSSTVNPVAHGRPFCENVTFNEDSCHEINFYLQLSDKMQALPTLLVDSAVSDLLVSIFISMPVVLWLFGGICSE